MRRLLTFLAVLAAVFAALTAYLFVLVPSDDPEHADAIVVLSGDRGRLSTGVRLFRMRIAPTLVISRDGRVWREADALCAQPRVVCFSADPYSTEGEAQALERMSRSRRWHELVVVTSRYHLRRSRMLFERCTTRRTRVVAAKTTLLDYAAVVPWEWGKLLYQLTVDRSC